MLRTGVLYFNLDKPVIEIKDFSAPHVLKTQMNGFWLESSLKISPKEQVKVLADIFNGKTGFTKDNIEILKEVMLTQKVGNVSVYGKTGTGQNVLTKHKDNGWFAGMIEGSGETCCFAVYLTDEDQEVTGQIAQEIAVNIIKRYYLEQLQ